METTKKKSKNWVHAEIQTFLDICIDIKLPKMLDSKVVRANESFKEVEQKLRELGYDRDYEQIKYKYTKLKSQFLKWKTNNNKSGNCREEFEYAEKMELLLDGRPCSELPQIGFESADVFVPENESIDSVCNQELPQSLASSSTPNNSRRQRRSTRRENGYANALNIFSESLRKTIQEQNKRFLDELRNLQIQSQEWEERMKKRDEEFLTNLANSSSSQSVAPIYSYVYSDE